MALKSTPVSVYKYGATQDGYTSLGLGLDGVRLFENNARIL